MLAYKGFRRGLICRGYQYFENQWNCTDKARCHERGFHCAENPLDCLVYYPSWGPSEYYLVEAKGDLDEDAVDSKIACTELFLKRKLELVQLLYEGLKYMIKKPGRNWSSVVIAEKGKGHNGYAVVRGKRPIISGRQQGDILVIAKEKAGSEEIEQGAVFIIDGINFHPNIWYDVNGNRVME